MSNRRERNNPLVRSSTPPIEEPVVEQPPQPEPVTAPPERRTLDLPPRPPVKRRRVKNKRFGDVYVTRSFSIDQRIVKYVDDYMSQGDTITSFANQLFLKILLDAGYDLDPDILTKPPK